MDKLEGNLQNSKINETSNEDTFDLLQAQIDAEKEFDGKKNLDETPNVDGIHPHHDTEIPLNVVESDEKVPLNFKQEESVAVRDSIHSNWDHLRDAGPVITNAIPTSSSKGKSIAFYVLIFGLIVFVIAIAYAGYNYYFDKTEISDSKISLSLDLGTGVKSGEVHDIVLNLTNANQVSLQDAAITIEYDKGKSVDGVTNAVKKVLNFGELKSQNFYSTTSSYMLLGKEGDMRTVKATLTYKIQGANSIFQKVVSNQVKILASNVLLNAEGPTSVIEDHEFSLKFTVKNVSSENFVPSILVVEPPAGYIVKKRSDNSDPLRYPIQTLKVGESATFSVTGFLNNSLSNSKTFKVNLSEYSGGEVKTNYASNIHEVANVPYPIDGKFTPKIVNQEVKEYVAGSENSMNVSVTNITQDYITDVYVFAQDGNEKVTFDKNTVPTLARIDPNNTADFDLFIKNIGTASTTIPFEVYGTRRGEDSAILLKRFTVNVPTRQGVDPNAF